MGYVSIFTYGGFRRLTEIEINNIDLAKYKEDSKTGVIFHRVSYSLEFRMSWFLICRFLPYFIVFELTNLMIMFSLSIIEFHVKIYQIRIYYFPAGVSQNCLVNQNKNFHFSFYCQNCCLKNGSVH